MNRYLHIHRTAAELLKAGIEEMQNTNAKLTDAERRKRQEAFDYARASVELEGFKLTTEDERHAQRFIAGEIDLEAFVVAGGKPPAAKRPEPGGMER